MVFMKTGQNAPLRCLAGLLAKEGHAHGIFWRLVLAVTASLDCTAHDLRSTAMVRLPHDVHVETWRLLKAG